MRIVNHNIFAQCAFVRTNIDLAILLSCTAVLHVGLSRLHISQEFQQVPVHCTYIQLEENYVSISRPGKFKFGHSIRLGGEDGAAIRHLGHPKVIARQIAQMDKGS